VIQGRSSASLAAKALKGLRITGDVVREKFQCNEPAELGVFSLIDQTHAPTA
jgi:hypothetical protein